VPIMIRTGGQTGVDRAALDFAIRRNWLYGGWCPQGGWAEDQRDPPGIRKFYPNLMETPSKQPNQRTAWNVRDSHVTLILLPVRELEISPGTSFTRQAAELVFLRPCQVVYLSQPEAVAQTQDWLAQVFRMLHIAELWLNIAGPRESEAKGVYSAASQFLEALFP
jgi:hypothetical protein